MSQVAVWYNANSPQLQKKIEANSRASNERKLEANSQASKERKLDPQKISIKREEIPTRRKNASEVEVFTLDDSGDEDEDYLNRTENLLEDSAIMEEANNSADLREDVKVGGREYVPNERGGDKNGRGVGMNKTSNENHEKEIKALREKLEEALKSRDKFKKDMEVKANDLKSLQDRIPKMIGECTKYVEERDATNLGLEQELTKKNTEIAQKVAEVEKLQKEILEGKSKIESLGTTKVANEKLKQLLASRDDLLKTRDEALKRSKKEMEEIKTELLKKESEIKVKESKEKKAMVEMKESLQNELKRISSDSAKKVKVLEKKEKELQAKNKAKDDELASVKSVLELKLKSNEAELNKSKEENLETQVKVEKLTKMNTSCKQQFEQLNKLHKSLVAKSSKETSEKDSRISTLSADIALLKENLAKKEALNEKEKKDKETELSAKDDKMKELEAEGAAQKEKTDKLLEVLKKRGVQVRDLKKIIEDKAKQAEEKEANTKMILNQKDGQIVELIKKSNAKIQKKDEEVKRRLSEKDVALQNVQKENDEAKSVIQQFRQRLVAFDTQIQENIKTSKDQLVAKEKEIESLKIAHAKDRRRLVLDCSEKVNSVEQKLRSRALEHGQKLMEKERLLKENMAKAATKAEAARRELEQRGALLEEMEEQMKRQEVAEINKMNNHRNSLLAEQHKSKQLELSLANVSSKQLLMEESLAKLEAKLEQKRLLILKLRGVALYQEVVENSRNKEVRICICFSPLLNFY